MGKSRKHLRNLYSWLGGRSEQVKTPTEASNTLRLASFIRGELNSNGYALLK